MHAPDPILTASIFCNRRLDRVVHQAVGPALERLRAEHPEAEWGVWWVRYALNGDHLKVRIHGPAEHVDDARRALREAADALFAALPPADPDEARVLRPNAPAIDAEDVGAAICPDRTLLWTTYRRSHVSLGPKALTGDDAYVSRITTCLVEGAALVLESTALGEDGRIPGAARQRAVLRAVIGGLRAAGLGPGERAEYLAYHRDWLVRFNAADEAGEAHIRGGFGRQVEKMGATVQQMARAAAAQWEPAAPPAAPGAEGPWRDAVAGLAAWAEGRRGEPSPDPYTDHPAFPLVFKAFHGVANHAGLDMLNEAFLYHLLARVAEEVDGAAEAPALAEAYA